MKDIVLKSDPAIFDTIIRQLNMQNNNKNGFLSKMRFMKRYPQFSFFYDGHKKFEDNLKKKDFTNKGEFKVNNQVYTRRISLVRAMSLRGDIDIMGTFVESPNKTDMNFMKRKKKIQNSGRGFRLFDQDLTPLNRIAEIDSKNKMLTSHSNSKRPESLFS